MSLRDGVRGGFFFAALISGVAIIRVAIAISGFALVRHAGATSVASGAGWLLLWVIPAYFVGFGIAGAGLAATSHLSNPILRYGLSGALCGSSIYGAIGIGADLADGKALSLWETVTTIAVFGALFFLTGAVLGAWDMWKRRHRWRRTAPVQASADSLEPPPT
ncbi:MAG TPA: hypothetical protein VGO46_09530 [Gemmatimonadaceae bacterium]|nr:hypothetical protein [Gemmatimonadaceae bacterium]